MASHNGIPQYPCALIALQFGGVFLTFKKMQGLLNQGIDEFNRGFFFEAHDTWEELWRDTGGPDRLFFQGLIQTAVGFYHLENGNYKGACSQFTKALAKLGHYLPEYQGIDTGRLSEGVRACLHDAERVRDGERAGGETSKIPQICFV